METKENKSLSDLKSLKQFRFAKALFDNHSESEDELEFKRGDVLTVLSHNPKALIGWWLCVNHSDGRTGLAPANRLRSIPVPTCDGISAHRMASNSCFALSDMMSDQSKNDDSTRRKSWNDFPREQQNNYDIPIGRQNFSSNIDLYDIPSPHINNTYDIPISIARPPLLSASSGSSDEMRCDSSCHLSDDSVRKRLSDEEMADYSSDSIELEAIRSLYSVPKKTIDDLYDIPTNNRSISEQQVLAQNQDYDFPKTSNSSMIWNNKCLESLSEYEFKCLQSLEQIFKNFCFGTNWRSRDAIYSGHRVNQLQVLCNDLNTFLRQFVTLCNRSVLFAKTYTSDMKMINKLDQLVQQLTVSLNIVENCLKSMDTKKSWTLEKIVRTEIDVVGDDLDRLTACAKHISDDIRHIIATIRGNARLLFPLNDSPLASPPNPVIASKPPIAPKPMIAPKHIRQPSNTQLRPLPAVPVIESEIENEYNDYDDLAHDYVCLESKIESKIESNFNNNEWNENMDKEIYKEADKTEVKAFYLHQMRNCCQFLQQIISESIDLIRKNQYHLTKVSLLKDSKSVVICGQKMIFVGQTLVRNSSADDIESLNELINHLSDSLKTFVANVRKACLTGRSFPTNQSVETVNESLIEISVLANQLICASL